MEITLCQNPPLEEIKHELYNMAYSDRAILWSGNLFHYLRVYREDVMTSKKKRPLKDLAKRVAKRTIKPDAAAKFANLRAADERREAAKMIYATVIERRPLEDTSELTAAMEGLGHGRFDLRAFGCTPNYLQPHPLVQAAKIIFCVAFAVVVFLILGDWRYVDNAGHPVTPWVPYPWVQR